MSHLTLYAAKVCPFAQRTLITLKHKQLEYNYVEIDLDDKPSDFLEISPYGRVPVLQHNQAVIYESAIINEYLDEVFVDPKCLSTDFTIKAFMRIWIKYLDATFIPAFFNLLHESNENDQLELKKHFYDCLIFIEKEGLQKFRGQGPYFFGEQLSLVDISFYPILERFILNLYYRHVVIPKECVLLRQWYKALSVHPSIQKASHPAEFYLQHYQQLNVDKRKQMPAAELLESAWS